jgi:hypothetical protein
VLILNRGGKMLDFNVSLELKPEINMAYKGNIDALVITSCAMHMFANDDRMYSDLEAQTFNVLNYCADRFTFLDIEVGLTGYSGKPYPKLYTKCFTLFSDNYQLIKPMKMDDKTSETKINQRGETVFGIRYHFRSEEEMIKLTQCTKLLLECFFALEKPNNTYGLMCQLEKVDGKWTIKYANTYKPSYARNIKNLFD